MELAVSAVRCASRHRSASRLAAIAAALACGLSVLVAVEAPAQQFSAETPAISTLPLLYDTGAGMPRVYGVTRPLAPGWKASYGLGLADETALSTAFLRLDELFDSGELDARGSRENWRHFLGLEFAPMNGVALLGGIARAGGVNGHKGAALAPTGYERLRLSTGARWRGDQWGLDGSFAFIPTGVDHAPNDAGFFPGMGDSGPTWLLSLTVSRRF